MRNLPFPTRLLPRLAGGALLLAGCAGRHACGVPPSYPLTATQRAWAAPYPANAVLRFRNAATGYVRTYRVSAYADAPASVYRQPDCPAYLLGSLSAVIARTDSAAAPAEALHGVFLTAQAPQRAYRVGLNGGLAGFTLPAADVDAGRLVPPPATFAGRTYQGVLAGTFAAVTPDTSPRTVARVYVTKADGLIRFEERGGSAWDRL